MKKEKKIVLKGQKYATPKTESVEVKNQGVLCGSCTNSMGSSSIKSWS